MSPHPRPNIDALARALARWMVARRHEGRRSSPAEEAADRKAPTSSALIEMTRDGRARGEHSYSAVK